MRALRLLAHVRVRVTACEDAAHAQPLVDRDRSLDAVRPTRQANVHEDQIGTLALGKLDCFLRRRREPDDLKTAVAQTQFVVDGDKVLVFDDQNARHGSAHKFGDKRWQAGFAASHEESIASANCSRVATHDARS